MRLNQIFYYSLIIFFLFNILVANNLDVELIADGLNKPVYLAAVQNSSDKLFIVEQHGVIWFYKNKIKYKELLNITDRVHNPKMPADERGLLGLALHPSFKENGFIYLNYINKNDSSIISRFQVDLDSYLVDKNSEVILIKFSQPYSNHNGGQLAFGPDDYLYVGVGDGGYAGDPYNNGQNKETIFGTILRVNVDKINYDLKQMIWCYGLRNPWRFSFDRLNGDLYIGDVGQNNWEEINYTPFNDVLGTNYGWNIMEGSHCYPLDKKCNKKIYKGPVFEYPNNANYIKTLIGWRQNNAQGCSVTGGYVYRGKLEKLQNFYIFGDYCTGKVWSFSIQNEKSVNYKEWKINNLNEDLYISSFGEDGNGELYIINHTGSVYKIINAD